MTDRQSEQPRDPFSAWPDGLDATAPSGASAARTTAARTTAGDRSASDAGGTDEMPPPTPGAAASGTTTEPAGEAEKEWWDDPGLPWKHKPTRSDKACMAWIAFMGVFGLALLPFRAWMLARSPWVLVSLTGSRSGTSALGALARTGGTHMWWLALVLGSLMSIKFDWVFWWAGRLWGRGMIEVWAGQSPRAQRTYARAERWAEKFGWLGMFLAYVPIPLPLMQVIFVLAGAQGWSVRKFMLLDFLSSTLWLCGYFALGWAVGAPAVELLKLYAKVAQYVAIGVVVVIIGSSVLRGRRKTA